MGGSASLLQIPHDVLIEAEAVKGLGGTKSDLHQIQLSSEVLANVRRRSHSESNRSNYSKRKIEKAAPHEVPLHVRELFFKIGIKSAPSKTSGHSSNTKRLVAHIFECLDGLQHLVKADQDLVQRDDTNEAIGETHSVMETNRECVGQLLHEMIALYTLCGDTVKVLLQASPEAARVEDAFGRLPLHVTVDRDQPWMDAVGRLIEAYPQALNRRDGGGRLPLHIAVDRQEPNVDVVQLLLQHNPHAAMGRRGVGRLPLHYAVFTDKPRLEVVQALLAAAPESAQTADVYGRLPLHYAVDKASVDMDVVECLLSAFPAGQVLPCENAIRLSQLIFTTTGAAVRDAHSKLPLTIALGRDPVDLRVVRLLLDAYPGALIERGGPFNKLPLQSLVDTQPRNLDAISFLARRCCEAITLTSDAVKRDSPVLIAQDRGLTEVSRMLLLLRPEAAPARLRELNWRARKIAFVLAKKQIFRRSVLRRLANLAAGLSPNTSSTSALRRFSSGGVSPSARTALLECSSATVGLSDASAKVRTRAHSISHALGPNPRSASPKSFNTLAGTLTPLVLPQEGDGWDANLASGSGDSHDMYHPRDSPTPRRSGSGSPRGATGAPVNFYLRLYKTNSDAFRVAVMFL